MAYSKNILPMSATYYSVSNAYFEGTELHLSSNGYAELQLSASLIESFTSNMLVVAHSSVVSNGYTNDKVQITLSLVDSEGNSFEYLMPVQYSSSGVFNTTIEMPGSTIVSARYIISSLVPAVLYNWELCTEVDSDIDVVIDGVTQSLPRLLYDYNTYAYAVGQKETTVGLITCYLKSATDLQGHFTISFFATEKCNVHVRIKDNGLTELYTPQVYTVERGYASVSIPHAYLKKLATDHNFSVTIQCTNGQLSIPVRGVLYTIDGGYLATRLLDAGIDTIDVGIRQLENETKPSEIWALGFEGNQLILKQTTYSNSTGWTVMKSFDEALTGALEFPGYWYDLESTLRYSLSTAEVPYVAVVDSEGNLFMRYGDNFNEEHQVDTNVVSVSMCQGFNSTEYEEQDQGLIVAYVKDNKVYIVQRLRRSDNWPPPVLFYDSVEAISVKTHRLPDYRLGLCIEHSNGTKWLISDRTYVGQSVKTDRVSALPYPVAACTILDVDHINEPTSVVPTLRTLTPGVRYHDKITMTFDYPIVYAYSTSERGLIEAISVYINNEYVSTDITAISNNAFLIMLDKGYISGSTVRVEADYPGVMLKMYNGSWAMINLSASYMLPLNTVEVAASERLNGTVTSVTTTTVRGIETFPVDIIEEVNEVPDISLTCTVSLTHIAPIDAYETVTASASPLVTVEPKQTGVSPI